MPRVLGTPAGDDAMGTFTKMLGEIRKLVNHQKIRVARLPASTDCVITWFSGTILACIIIIIIQYLYSALKSCKGYGGAGGFRLRLSEQVCFEVFFKGV